MTVVQSLGPKWWELIIDSYPLTFTSVLWHVLLTQPPYNNMFKMFLKASKFVFSAGGGQPSGSPSVKLLVGIFGKQTAETWISVCFGE